MHPDLIRSFVTKRVGELRRHLEDRPDLQTGEVTLDLGAPEIFLHFDHEALRSELVTAASPLLLPGGQRIARQQRVPILGGGRVTRRLILHMQLDGYDLRPPTANLLDAAGDQLPADRWPQSFDGRGIVARHRLYDRPFFCRPGLREYHSHPEHEDDPWAKWRDGLPLHTIVIPLLSDLRTRWHNAA